jgi:cytidine deaminase
VSARDRGDAESAEALHAEAAAAAARAYSPYSGLRVGAVLEGADGRRHAGANVEFASYGLTVCAERTALLRAVTEGERAFRRIGIAAVRDGEIVPAAPCGACRQALAEFGLDLAVVYLGAEGLVERPLRELLADAFLLEA